MMVSAFITFLSSSAGGALFRFDLQWLSSKEEAEKPDRLRAHEDQLSQRKQPIEWKRADNEILSETPIKIRKKVTKTFPWIGSCVWESEKEYFPRSRRSGANVLILGMLAFTYCACLLLYATFPDVALTTLDPAEEPTKVNILFIGWEYSRKNPVTITTGGVAYMMAHPLVFILTAWLTGLPFQQGKTR